MLDRKNSGAGRRIWIAVVVTAVLVALAVYRFTTTGFDWHAFLAKFVNMDWLWLSASIALLFLSYVGRAVRWEVMLRPLEAKPNLWNITSATIIGFTGVVLLGRAGELVRPYLIAVKEGVPFSSQMAAWFLERIFDLLMVLLIFGIALARMPTAARLVRTGGYFVASVGVICIILLIAFRNFAGPAQRRILAAVSFLPEKAQVRLEKILGAFVEGMKCTREPRFLALLVIYTILEWIVVVGQYYCIFRALPDTAWFGLDQVMVFLGFVAFGSIVQIPGIGGGVQVASYLVLKEILGTPPEAATAMAILIWLLTWVIVVPFGLALAFHEGINWKKISHISENVEPQP